MAALAQVPKNLESELVLLNINTGKEKVILREKRHFEAPNWSRDGKFLIINSNGKLEKISVSGKKLRVIDTGFADNCNNDHGLTFDGKWLIISHNYSRVSSPGGNSRIFILPASGGVPRLITENYPSYWHGVSPDNQWVTYCAMKREMGCVQGASWRRNQADRRRRVGRRSEYSYDGQWIYFNSHRGGRMHIYRMRPDGSEQTRLTFDDPDNWFPTLHPTIKARRISRIWKTRKAGTRSGRM